MGVPVGTPVGALDVLEIDTDTKLVDVTEMVEEVVTGTDVDVEVDVAMHEQALLTRLTTSPVQAATAYEGIATAEAVVNVAQNDCASAIFAGARRARRQLSALHDAASAKPRETVEARRGARREVREGMVNKITTSQTLHCMRKLISLGK